MKQTILPGSGLLIAQGRIIRVDQAKPLTRILGYDRKRDIVWDTLVSCTNESEQRVLRVWTTLGDCSMLPSSRLSTPLGELTASSVAAKLQNGDDVQIEMTKIRRLTEMDKSVTNFDSLLPLISHRLLTFKFCNNLVLRAPVGRISELLELLTALKVRVVKTTLGEYWGWVAIKDYGVPETEDGCPLSSVAQDAADFLTGITTDGVTKWVTARDESLLRVLVQLKLMCTDKSFEVSVSPKVNPLEVQISQTNSWHPYARTLSVTSEVSATVNLQFATPAFSPLVNCFMLLS